MFFLCSTFQNLPPIITRGMHAYMYVPCVPLNVRLPGHATYRGHAKEEPNTSCNPNNACVDKVTQCACHVYTRAMHGGASRVGCVRSFTVSRVLGRWTLKRGRFARYRGVACDPCDRIIIRSLPARGALYKYRGVTVLLN